MFTVLDAVPQSVVAFAQDGTVVWGNQAFRQASGWSLAEIEAGRAGRVVSASGAPPQAGEQGLLYVDARGGGRCAESMTVSAIPGDTGNLMAVGDIGEEEIYCRVGVHGEIQRAGAGLCALLDRDASAITGVELQELITPSDRARLGEELGAAQNACRGVFSTRVGLTNARGTTIRTRLWVLVRDEAQVARDEIFHQMLHALAIVRVSASGECVLELPNAAFAELAGMANPGSAAVRLEDVLEPGTAALLTDACRRCATERRRVELQIRQKGKGGALTWKLSLVGSQTRVGSSTWVLLVAQDISPELEAMRLAQEKEELYRSVVDDQAELISRFDAEGTFLFMNGGFCRFYGVPMEALIGKRWQSFVSEADAVEIEKRFAALTPDAPFGVSNGKTTNEMGEERWLEFVNRAYFDDRGQLQEILAVGRDVTARKQGETELAARTAELKAIYEHSPVILIQFDLEGVVKSVSPSCSDSVGWTDEELIGRRANWINHPEEQVELDRVLARLSDSEEAVKLRHRVRARNGEYRWMQTTLRRTGHTIYSASVDISEQVATEHALLREQTFHETLFQTMSQGVVYQSANGEILNANPAAESILGVSLEEMRLRSSEDPRWTTRREDETPFPGLEHPAMVALRTGNPVHDVVMQVYNSRERGFRWINITAIPRMGAGSGSPIGVYAIFQDISIRIRALHSLRDSEQMLQLSLEASRSASWIWELETDRHVVSPILGRLLGRGDSEVADFQRFLEESLHPGDREKAAELMATLRTSESVVDVAIRMRHADGHFLHLAVHAKKAATVAGSGSRRVVGMIQDVSDLVEARERAERYAKSRSDFLANMSHEIRTPMNGVIGMTSLLMETPLQGEQRGFVESIQASGESLLTLINDVLDLSKIEAGALHLEEVDFEPAALAEDAVEMLTLTAATKGLTMDLAVAPEVPLEVRGDPTRLRQVLLNLVSNAVKFTHTGSVMVNVSRAPDDGDNVVLQVAVADTGIGITEEQQKRLFRAFEQAERSTTRHFGGTGLGLAIARSLVEQMGGGIGVESHSGEGSTFRFTVKVRPSKRDGGARGVAGRVLVVEGHASRRKLLVRQLEWIGATAAGTADPQEALALARDGDSGPWDLILLGIPPRKDDTLPWVSALREGAPFAGVPLLLVGTSTRRLQSNEGWAELGIRDQLLHPLRLEGLREAVRRVTGTVSAAGQQASRERAGKRVLVADDNRVNREVARIMLQKLGCTVTTVENGLEAVRAEGPFDLILMDCQMPVVDGLEATRQIRLREGTGPRTPVVALTACVLTEEESNCFDAGMDGFLTKPVSVAAIRKILDRWVPA